MDCGYGWTSACVEADACVWARRVIGVKCVSNVRELYLCSMCVGGVWCMFSGVGVCAWCIENTAHPNSLCTECRGGCSGGGL